MKIKRIIYLFLIIKLSACSQKPSNKEFDFSAFKIIVEEKVMIEIKSNGDIIDQGKLVAKVKKENGKGFVIGLDEKVAMIISGDEVTNGEGGYYLCTVNKQGKGTKDSKNYYEVSKEGNFIINGKTNKSVKIATVNNKSYQLATIILMCYK